MLVSTTITSKSRKGTVRRCTLFFLSSILLLAQLAWGQGTPTSLELYANAMKQGQVADQISGLEKYLGVADSTLLKQDALEVLIWDYLRMGSAGHAQQRATDLMKLDPNNPVAVAVLGRAGQQSQKAARNAGKDEINSAQAALTAMEKLRRPEGMLAGDFAAMRRHVESSLNGMLGLAYVDRQQYQLARTPLQQAVAVAPQNPQYAYALGLALLYSKDEGGNEQNAFLYLARAVDLTQGTPGGQQIADFARKQYHKAGGKDAEWNQYLAAAVVPENRTQQPAAVASFSPSSPAGVSSTPTAVASATAAPAPSPTTTARTPAVAQTSTTYSAKLSKKQEAKLLPPDLPPSSIPKPTPAPEKTAISIDDGVRTPYAPVSLGILIETALLTKQNRPAILAALRDVISHLRGEDEAAILVFSNQLDFEQDLTANDQLLEQAINGLQPRRSRALLDGIAFAAGHLKRIGKNPTRVLLVISDGRGQSQNINRDSAPLSAQLRGVRVDCIGLHADGADQRALLERLASYSGGQARFADGPEQFQTVAMEMTGFLGVHNR